MIVDDPSAIRKILIRVLPQIDLPIKRVHEANDGLEALKIVEANDISLILSDINIAECRRIGTVDKASFVAEMERRVGCDD
jgi:YesN/AraC family two-component response regulator